MIVPYIYVPYTRVRLRGHFSTHTDTAAATIAVLTTENIASNSLLSAMIETNMPVIEAANDTTSAKLNAILFFMCLLFLIITEYNVYVLGGQTIIQHHLP